MKQIYYVIQALIHGRGANIIKVVSLGLGLTMSILLFSRVVYEQSFDTCFKDHDKLYQLWNIWTVNGEPFPLWGIERSGFFNGREKWAKGFENQRV